MGHSVSTFGKHHTVEAVLFREPTNVAAVADPGYLIFEQGTHEVTVTMKIDLLLADSDLHDLVNV
jgi:hypothetical protein